jgi:hypothetical protein
LRYRQSTFLIISLAQQKYEYAYYLNPPPTLTTFPVCAPL